MKRALALMTAGMLVPATAASESDRERGFAVCLTITPGLGAASLGHPGRGAANFGLFIGGGILLSAGAATIDSKGRPNSAMMTVGGVAMVSAYIWAGIDGSTLEPTEDFTEPRRLPKNWRPGNDPVPTPTPVASATRDEPDEASEEPGEMPAAIAHVPDPTGRTFIKTQRAGLQEVQVGRRVRVSQVDGNIAVGTILEVSDVAIVIDANGQRLQIDAPDISEITKAK